MSERRMRRFREQEEEEDAKRGGGSALPESRQRKRGEQERGEQERGEQERGEQEREDDEEERGLQRYKTVVPGRDRPDYAAYGRRRAPSQSKKGDKHEGGYDGIDLRWDGVGAMAVFHKYIGPFQQAKAEALKRYHDDGLSDNLYSRFSNIACGAVLELMEIFFISAGGPDNPVTSSLYEDFKSFIEKYHLSAFAVGNPGSAHVPSSALRPAGSGESVSTISPGKITTVKRRSIWQKLRGAGKALKRAFATGSGAGLHSKTRTQATPEALTRRAARRLERLGYTYKASEDGGVAASAWPPPTREGGTTSC